MNNEPHPHKYLDLIVCASVAMIIIANTTAAKIIHFGIFTVSVTVLYFPVTYIFSDLLTEVYGYRQARRAMWIMIAAEVVTAVVYQFVAVVPPAAGFKNNEAYQIVFGQAPRIVIGGMIALFAGQFANDFTMAKMKVYTGGKLLWTRTVSSTIAGQFFDTTLFYAIALYNVIPAGLLVPTILSGWAIKSSVETIMTPVTYALVNRLKKLEHENYFDRQTNFNPFIFHLNKQK